MSRPLVIAHRGASGRETENSLAAFRAARDLGADAVELDVHATVDGAIVVHHDPVVDGVHIPWATLAQIRAQRLPNGEPVPTLDEALAIIHPLMAFVEVKSLDPRWDANLFAVFDRSPAPGRIAVHAFDHRIIRRLGAARPALPRGVLLASYPVHPTIEMEDAGASALWQHAELIDQPLASAVHAAGGALYAWTVDDPAEMRRLLDAGVDGLCSNHPDRARIAIDSLPQ